MRRQSPQAQRSSSTFSLLRGRKAVGEGRDFLKLRLWTCYTSKCVHSKGGKTQCAAWTCCDTVCVCVCVCVSVCSLLFSQWLYMCCSSLQRSRGLMGTWTKSSVQPLGAAPLPPPPLHPLVSPSYTTAATHRDTGQTWQTRPCWSRHRNPPRSHRDEVNLGFQILIQAIQEFMFLENILLDILCILLLSNDSQDTWCCFFMPSGLLYFLFKQEELKMCHFSHCRCTVCYIICKFKGFA